MAISRAPRAPTHSSNAVPPNFKIANYDDCHKWRSARWAKALELRFAMGLGVLLKGDKQADEILSDESERQKHLDQARALMKDPIRLDYRSIHCCLHFKPVSDQTVDEYFQGARLFTTDIDYFHWFARLRIADELGVDLDRRASFRGGVFGLLQYGSVPAWEMHKAISPTQQNGNDHLFVRVNLEASDAYIIESFKQWLKEARKRNNNDLGPTFIEFPSTYFHSLLKDGLLPLLDLLYWKSLNKSFSYTNIAEILNMSRTAHDAEWVDEEMIRKTLRPKALSLLSKDTIVSMNYLPDNYG